MDATSGRNDDALVVTTTHGPVKGFVDGDTSNWLGIPYAAAPTGERRFRRPEAPEPWTDVRPALEYGASPMQTDAPAASGGLAGTTADEDCLTINVSRPRGDRPEALPVMVWIYGGAFQLGTSRAYPAQTLTSSQDVVVVTFNYRVGAFGFVDFSGMSNEDHQFDANVGLRDQVAALRWVQDNIASFGGDPDNVTIFGQSAGGISVTTLMCVPEAHGLFHRAISESSAASSVFGRELARSWAEQFVTLLGDGEDTVAKRLIAASAEEILEASTQLAADVASNQPGGLATSPVVDGEFLPERPIDAFKAGRAARVPLIIGAVEHEGRAFAFLVKRTGEMLPVTDGSLERMFQLTDPAARDTVIAAYPGYPGKSVPAQAGGDIEFWYPSAVIADAHSQYAPTWSYRFDYSAGPMRLLGLGALHGAEIKYVFNRPVPGGIKGLLQGGRKSRELATWMSTTWTGFAKDGAPGTNWPAYDATTRSTLIIDHDTHVEDDPWSARREAWSQYRFWDEIGG